MQSWTCIAIGLAGGVLSGLLGIGGGIVLIPLMVFLLKMTQHQAQGTSLAVICLSFISVLVYYKKGHINLSVATLIGVGFILGGFLGAYFAGCLPDHVLRRCFAVLMIIMAIEILISK
ncbi:MAG: sulfite exporter TauE/SafE family protein [Clostridiales Family XIII bacterium]|jgi:uncharacterized membrane protein YfcA|nr:sulfite exporter TauE/SafE family protein [Clostridiales Family XIII bacterium]